MAKDTKPEVYAKYNCIDCVVTLEIWDAIKNDLDSYGFREIYEQTLQLFPLLLYMSNRGFKVSTDRLHEESTRVIRKIRELQAALDAAAGFPLNVNSPKQMNAFFYDHLRHKPYTDVKTGARTTNDKALSRLARKPDELTRMCAKLCQELRKLRKLHSTYLEVKLDDDNRVRCQWNARGTIFGRLSSSQTILGTGMNLQNLDPRFKGFLVADEGKVLIEMDKAQAEWIVSAYFFDEPSMIEVCESGKDPHVMTAVKMTGLSEELILEEKKILDHATSPEEIKAAREKYIPQIFKEAKFLPRIFSCRQGAKKSNHGLNYVMTYKRFAFENEMPEGDAKMQVAMYHIAYPRLKAGWDKYVRKHLEKDRLMYNLFGRPYRFIGPLNDDLFKQAVSYVPQSTVSDIIHRASIAAFNDQDGMPELDMMSQTHDSVTFQAPRDVETICRLMRKMKFYMEPTLEAHGRTFGIGTDAKIGGNWGSYRKDENDLGMFEINLNDDGTLEDQVEEQLKRIGS